MVSAMQHTLQDPQSRPGRISVSIRALSKAGWKYSTSGPCRRGLTLKIKRRGTGMEEISRRGALALGAGFAAASAFGARAAVPIADVPAPKLPRESGATLRVLRPAKFVDPDEAVFTANSKKYTEQTGIPVRVDYLAWDN